jgi:hypothetical protein
LDVYAAHARGTDAERRQAESQKSSRCGGTVIPVQRRELKSLSELTLKGWLRVRDLVPYRLLSAVDNDEKRHNFFRSWLPSLSTSTHPMQEVSIRCPTKFTIAEIIVHENCSMWSIKHAALADGPWSAAAQKRRFHVVGYNRVSEAKAANSSVHGTRRCTQTKEGRRLSR